MTRLIELKGKIKWKRKTQNYTNAYCSENRRRKRRRKEKNEQRKYFVRRTLTWSTWGHRRRRHCHMFHNKCLRRCGTDLALGPNSPTLSPVMAAAAQFPTFFISCCCYCCWCLLFAFTAHHCTYRIIILLLSKPRLTVYHYGFSFARSFTFIL